MSYKHNIILLLLCIIFLSSCENIIEPSNRLGEIKKEGIIHVGVFPNFEPMIFMKDNLHVGYDADIVKIIEKELNVKAVYHDIEFNDLFNASKNKEVDIIISSITITAERSKNILFSTPYFDGGQVVIIKKDSTFNTINSLENKTVGVLTGTTGEIATFNIINPKTVLSFLGRGNISLLEKGEIDAWVEDFVIASSVIKENPNFRIMGDSFTQEYYGIGTSPDNKELMTEINSILRKIKSDGTLNELKKKWII